MRKNPLHPVQKPMTDLSAVDEAGGWADALVRREHRGPGDTVDAAIHRAARRHQVPERTLRALRYRKPKEIAASVYRALMRAYDAECARQEAKLRHELQIARSLPATPDRLRLIREVEAVLGSPASEAGGQEAHPAEDEDQSSGWGD